MKDFDKYILLRYHYGNLTWPRRLAVRLKLASSPHFKRQYKALRDKLTIPSAPPPDKNALWEKIAPSLKQQQAEVDIPSPVSFFFNIPYLAAGMAALAIIAITFWFLFRPAVEEMTMTLSSLQPGSFEERLPLPVKTREFVTGAYALKIIVPPFAEMTLMPGSRLKVESITGNMKESMLDGRLELASGGVYVSLNSRRPGQNMNRESGGSTMKIKWTVITPAGTVSALGTTFFISLHESNRTAVFLKEGALEITTPDKKSRLESPGCGGIDGSTGKWLPMEKIESQKIIPSFFREIEGSIEQKSEQGINNILNKTRVMGPNLFPGHGRDEKSVKIFMPREIACKVHLAKGMVLFGKIVSQSSTMIVLETEEGTFNIKKHDIKKIDTIK